MSLNLLDCYNANKYIFSDKINVKGTIGRHGTFNVNASKMKLHAGS